MKRLALTALAAAISVVGLASSASADSRYDNDDEWRRHGQRDGGDWDGRRDGDREARRRHDDNDEWRWRDRRPHWRHHHRPHWTYRYDRDICWVKKVRRYDDWGNVYIKRIRVCR